MSSLYKELYVNYLLTSHSLWRSNKAGDWTCPDLGFWTSLENAVTIQKKRDNIACLSNSD